MIDDSNQEQLSEDLRGDTSRTQAEASALREQPEHDRIGFVKGLERLLSSVPREALGTKNAFIEHGRASVVKRIAAYVAPDSQRYNSGLQGRRADLIIVDDVGLKSADYSKLEERVLAHMVRDGETWYHTDYRGRYKLLDKKTVRRRSRQNEVQTVHSGEIPEWARIPLEDKSSKTPKHDKGQLQVRRDNRGGRSQRDTSRRVSADIQPSRHKCEAGSARHDPECRICGEPSRWCVARPGHSRAIGFCKAHGYAFAYGAYGRVDQIQQGPEEPN